MFNFELSRNKSKKTKKYNNQNYTSNNKSYSNDDSKEFKE